jgi:hypothetical protein
MLPKNAFATMLVAAAIAAAGANGPDASVIPASRPACESYTSHVVKARDYLQKGERENAINELQAARDAVAKRQR